MSLIEQLEWDSAFFGIPVGRVRSEVGVDEIAAVIGEAEQRKLRCVYLLVPADNSRLVTVAEECGFRVREIRVELQRSVAGHPARIDGLRVGSLEDLSVLAPIARSRIRGTRFFADDHFASERAAELYVEWLRRGLTDTTERQTLVDGNNRGFVVCHKDVASGIGTIELIAVDQDAAGRGLGKSLIAGAGAVFRESRMHTATVVTQGSNINAQALYQSCGYRTAKMFYWLHAWSPLTGSQ